MKNTVLKKQYRIIVYKQTHFLMREKKYTHDNVNFYYEKIYFVNSSCYKKDDEFVFSDEVAIKKFLRKEFPKNIGISFFSTLEEALKNNNNNQDWIIIISDSEMNQTKNYFKLRPEKKQNNFKKKAKRYWTYWDERNEWRKEKRKKIKETYEYDFYKNGKNNN